MNTCQVCKGEIKKNKQESYEQYENRKYCSHKCYSKSKAPRHNLNVVGVPKRPPAIIHDRINTFLYAYGRVA